MDAISPGVKYNKKFDELIYPTDWFKLNDEEQKSFKTMFEIYQEKKKQNLEESTVKVITEVADSIEPMIKFTGDYPTNHESQKLPILDIQVQMNTENRVLFEFYEKETKTDKVILASSAMSWHQKFQILTNEALRRLRNTSQELGVDIQNFHLSKFSVKMKDSGYNPKFRSRVIKKS